MPNAVRLVSEGGIMNLTVDDHITETTPGHVEMLTGYPPNITGAYSNLQYSIIPSNLTVFERLKGYFGKNEISTVMLTGKPLIIEYITDPSQLEVINWTMNETHPFYTARSSIDSLDLNRANASVVGSKAVAYFGLYKDIKSFMFIHFRDPDNAGHDFGENSEEYDAAIVECDCWLGTMLSTLQSLGTYNRTIIYVMTDHGFNEGEHGHSYAPDIWLITNDPCINSSITGYQSDIAPTIYAKFGIDSASFSPQLPGRSLTSLTIIPGGCLVEGIAAQVIGVAIAVAATVVTIFLLRKSLGKPFSTA